MYAWLHDKNELSITKQKYALNLHLMSTKKVLIGHKIFCFLMLCCLSIFRIMMLHLHQI